MEANRQLCEVAGLVARIACTMSVTKGQFRNDCYFPATVTETSPLRCAVSPQIRTFESKSKLPSVNR